MWGSGYWTQSYWPLNYWPEAGGTGPIVSGSSNQYLSILGCGCAAMFWFLSALKVAL